MYKSEENIKGKMENVGKHGARVQYNGNSLHVTNKIDRESAQEINSLVSSSSKRDLTLRFCQGDG